MASRYTEWVAAHRGDIIADIKRLVDIKSVKSAPEPGAPYGADVRAVQLEAMRMCEEAGLAVTDLDGRIAYAHFGDPDRFLGIIAHLDVVPEGTGWDSDPYCMTEREGYLVGRGVSDDKGPFVLALWAIRYLLEHNVKLNYGIRLILGLDEECGMQDLLYYNERCKEPVFGFTPDSGFPVGHGEKGIYSSVLASAPISGVVRDMQGGVAGNVVPDHAWALLDPACSGALRAAVAGQECYELTEDTDGLRLLAKGVARHAGSPAGGISAIHLLAKCLLEAGVLSESERAALAFVETATADFSGAQFGIDCDDGIFTPLTIIAGTLALRDGCVALGVNCRYPTNIAPEELEARIVRTATDAGFSVCDTENSKPFYLPADHPAVALLCKIYNEISGSDEKPFVMSGGTYARHMKNAVSYGIETWTSAPPAWVGSAHMKNEATSIDGALTACEIFIDTLVQLQDITL